MENQLQIFHSPEFGNIRIIEIDGEPWLVAKDVATILGYQKPENAVANHVDPEDKTTTLIQGTGSNYKSKAVLINESGFYQLCFGSKLPSAREFRRWITHDVLPSIRKNGYYLDSRGRVNPRMVMKLCQQMIDLEEENEKLESQVAEMKPKASYYDLILNSQGLLTVSEIAQDYGMSAKRFNQILKNLGIQYQLPGQKTWILKSKYAAEGYVQSQTSQRTTKSGDILSKSHTYWTQKGRFFLYNKLKENNIIPVLERQRMQTSLPIRVVK